ncbi:hypothetical protein ACQJBY_057753 [Aegilops geniculata]
MRNVLNNHLNDSNVSSYKSAAPKMTISLKWLKPTNTPKGLYSLFVPNVVSKVQFLNDLLFQFQMLARLKSSSVMASSGLSQEKDNKREIVCINLLSCFGNPRRRKAKGR